MESMCLYIYQILPPNNQVKGLWSDKKGDGIKPLKT